jgi:hypothetical protein
MTKVAITPNASGTGTFTIAAPNSNTNRTLTLPDVTTTLVGTDATQTLTNKSIAATQLTGDVAAARITNALNATGSAPIYACRAWVNFDGTTTTPTIRASGNVSSITRVTTGQFTLNFATAMPDVNYIVVGGGGAANSNTVLVAQPINDHPPATTSFRFNTYFGNNSIVNTAAAFVAVFR